MSLSYEQIQDYFCAGDVPDGYAVLKDPLFTYEYIDDKKVWDELRHRTLNIKSASERIIRTIKRETCEIVAAKCFRNQTLLDEFSVPARSRLAVHIINNGRGAFYDYYNGQFSYIALSACLITKNDFDKRPRILILTVIHGLGVYHGTQIVNSDYWQVACFAKKHELAWRPGYIYVPTKILSNPFDPAIAMFNAILRMSGDA